jgi:hypothetical protein
VDEYGRFILVEEIKRFMKFSEADVNVFRYVEKKDVLRGAVLVCVFRKEDFCTECKYN